MAIQSAFPLRSNASGPRRLAALAPLVIAFLAVACGARTGLYPGDASFEEDDAGIAGSDGATHDAPADVSDAKPEADAPFDVDAEAEAEAATDGPDPYDAPEDVIKNDCTDPTIQYVYVVTTSANLYSFRPSSLSFALIGQLSCPSTTSPFSMAVDRKGTAYVEYQDGSIFRVSVATASCEPTPWVPGTGDFVNFGMGYSTDEGGPAESLYLAGSGYSGESPRLGRLDTETFTLTEIGPLSDPGYELTGTGDGRLYGFFQPEGTFAHLVRLDKQNAGIDYDVLLPGVGVGSGWAFSFWGGDFYFFTAEPGYTTVTRFQPDLQNLSVVASLPDEVIVGAGASTCAPEK